jgi:hypothetical protein
MTRVQHIRDGLARVISQYRWKPRLNTNLAILLNQVQLLDDAISAVLLAFDLDTAVGWRLDWLGGLVGQPRRGTSDEVYRVYIRARIRVNRSLGKVRDIRTIADLLIGAGHYSYKDGGCRIDISVDHEITSADELLAIWEMLQQAAPGGVRVWLTTLVDASAGDIDFSFSLASGGEICPGPGGFCGSTSATDDGLLSSVRA